MVTMMMRLAASPGSARSSPLQVEGRRLLHVGESVVYGLAPGHQGQLHAFGHVAFLFHET